MGNGPALVIRGTILGSILVVCILVVITSTFTIPVTAQVQVNTPKAAGIQPANEFTTPESQVSNAPIRPCQLSIAYPDDIHQWCSLITQYAQEYGFPPDLIAALIWQESGGNPSAYSRSGAVGLMQVMPRDGLASSFMCVNGPCFANRPTTEELEDPEFNVMYGTRMLANLVKRYGNLREALKSYGPKDVGYSYADKVLGIYQRYHQ